MIDLIFIAVVALLASALTLISGFGLGTLMLPVFAVFFSIEVAVTITAVVHLLNNVFKFSLLYKSIDKQVLMRFGIPGIAGAFAGAFALRGLGEVQDIMIAGQAYYPIKLSIGLLMIFFALTEIFPAMLRLQLGKKYLVGGGLLSGFFGGLSGHQGALRSIFLIKLNLSKEAFIATGVAVALLVDLTRIPVYFHYQKATIDNQSAIAAGVATVAAFAGAWFGKKVIPKITIRFVQLTVGIAMILLALGLIFNVI